MEKTLPIQVSMSDGTKIKIMVPANKSYNDLEQKVSQKKLTYRFTSITEKITSISNDIVNSVKKIGLKKITVKFGLEIGVETNSLIAFLAKGSAKANLEVELEWEKP